MRAMSSALVVTAGTLTWELGIEFAIVAVARARAAGADLRYEIVGDGPERDRALYTAFDLGLEEVVRVVRADRPAVVGLAAADVFLWPDLVGRPSVAAHELASLGVPTVSTVDGPRARVVPARDPAQAATALVSALAVPIPHGRPELAPRAVASILRELVCG